MTVDLFHHPIVSLMIAVVVAGAETRTADAQKAPADTITAQGTEGAAQPETSGERRLLAFLVPEVGFVLGHSFAGRTGEVIGLSLGTAVGVGLTVRDATHRAERTPPTRLCFVPGEPPAAAQIIPGVPPTPGVGDMPGTPGSPDILVPGTPGAPDRWEPCR